MRFQLTVITSVLTSLLVLALANPSCQAQSGSTSSPVQSVPQYTPRYPLTQPDPIETPSSNNTINLPKPDLTPTQTPTQTPRTNLPQREPAPLVADPKTAPQYGVDYSIYRDTNLYPIDPRKPCNPCVRPFECGGCGGRLPGKNGKPYMEAEPGGCTCQKRNPGKHPQFSVHWPRPFSAKLDERFPDRAAERYSGYQTKRKVDLFDHLSTFKLSAYRRTDNGYCGSGADPYGCLGESQQRSNVIGVGYRFPSEPVDRGLNSLVPLGEGYGR